MSRCSARVAAIFVLGLPLSFLLVGANASAPSFNNRILEAHNRERAALGLRYLGWNADLAAGAKQWADHLARTERFEHSPDDPGTIPLGENIWGGTTGRFEPEAMVGLWIAEKRHFKPGVFPATSDTGNVRDVSHYTQVVWRRSSEVGCALARGRREDILVCRYSEPGNVIGTVPF